MGLMEELGVELGVEDGSGVRVLWLELELKFEWVGGWSETGMKDCVCSDNFFYEELRLGSMCDLIGVIMY
jgi:hypothetical protein